MLHNEHQTIMVFGYKILATKKFYEARKRANRKFMSNISASIFYDTYTGGTVNKPSQLQLLAAQLLAAQVPICIYTYIPRDLILKH